VCCCSTKFAPENGDRDESERLWNDQRQLETSKTAQRRHHRYLRVNSFLDCFSKC